MENKQEQVLSRHIGIFVARRVEELTTEAEQQTEYINARASIQEFIDKDARSMDSENLETLISAIRGADIPIYEYIYQMGVKDGIWLSEKIEHLRKHE